MLVKDELIYCACGCGKIIDKYDKRGRERKFILGHSARLKGKKLIESDINEIIRLYTKELWGCRTISKLFKISNSRVYKILKNRKIDTSLINRIKLGAVLPCRFITDKKEIEKLIDLYANKRESSNALAKVYGCSNIAILNTLRRNGIKIRTVGESRKGKFLGKDNPSYKERIIKSCEHCKKDFFVIPCYSYQRFCSKKCSVSGKGNPMFGRSGENSPAYGKEGYWTGKKQPLEMGKKRGEKLKGRKVNQETREKIGKANSGEKHGMYGKENRWGHHKKESIEKIKLKRANQIFPKKDSSIEIKIQNYLKQLNIEFFTHQYMKIPHGYQCDIFIPSKNLVIECDGDFIHCNPLKYSSDFVRFPNSKKIITAQEIWDRDKIRTKELQEAGFKVLRLWEHEIKVMKIEDFQNKLNQIQYPIEYFLK